MRMEALIEGLHPELQRKARQHYNLCASKGISIVFTAGKRSSQEQLILFTQGRDKTANGIWHVIDPKLVVTNALPEHAPHCRGAAYDIVPIVAEKPAWQRLDLFQTIGDLGKSLGLTWGGDWPKLKDMPHFELPGWRLLPWG